MNLGLAIGVGSKVHRPRLTRVFGLGSTGRRPGVSHGSKACPNGLEALGCLHGPGIGSMAQGFGLNWCTGLRP